MTPKIVCGSCGNSMEASDKFCSACGAGVEMKRTSVPPAKEEHRAAGSGSVRCPLCGQVNAPASLSCESCGGSLGQRGSSAAAAPAARPAGSPKLPPLKMLQSWKLTLVLGVVLIATLVIVKSSRNDTPGQQEEGLSPHASGVAQEIRSLQKSVDANPQNADSVLRLANLYHDVRLFPKAIVMYERYLEINPSNPDARVDLGTSYFELSFEDSTRKSECLDAARQAMEKALTYAPRHQMALFNLGIIRFHTGEIESAIESFKKCVTVDSTSVVGKKALQFINQHASIDQSS